MACFNITKYGFVNIDQIMDDIIYEMTGDVANGATNNIKYFNIEFAGVPTDGIGKTSTNVTILSTTANVDPLATAQRVGSYVSMVEPGWRICFNQIDKDRLAVHVATALQLTDTGNIAQLNTRSVSSPALLEPAGNVGQDWNQSTYPGATQANFNKIWLNRQPSSNAQESYPMSYTLTLTNRGVFLGIWEDSQEEIPQGTSWDLGGAGNVSVTTTSTTNPTTGVVTTVTTSTTIPGGTNPDGSSGNSPFRWLLIQRPVDRLTGHVRGAGALRQDNSVAAETSRCPVYCVSGTGSPQDFTKFVVREVDVVSPSRKKNATIQSEDNPPLLNPYPQQSLTETGEFVVTFMNNLSTPRYKYADELDMLGTVAAEVVGAGTSVLVNVYNEPYQREYTALYSTERYGTGMRLMVLTKTGYTPGLSDATNLTHNIAVENSHTVYTP